MMVAACLGSLAGQGISAERHTGDWSGDYLDLYADGAERGRKKANEIVVIPEVLRLFDLK
jgi:hypothetical protein